MNNAGVVFKRVLTDHRSAIFWWGLAMGGMGLFIVAFYPLMEDMTFINDMIQQMAENPMIGGLVGDLGDLDYTSPAGFLGTEFFTVVPLILAIYAVTFGLSIVGNEEARGTLDTLLSTPLRRWQLIVEKSGAFFVAMATVLVMMCMCLVVGVALVPAMELSYSNLIMAVVATLPPLLVAGFITLFLTTVLRQRNIAAGIAALFLIASYFISTFAQMSSAKLLNWVSHISLYKYYDPKTILVEGMNWGHFTLLMGVSFVFFLLSISFFDKRDIYE